MAELFFLACAAPGSVEAGSAGVSALVGEPIDHGTAVVLSEIGLDPSRHRARQFEPYMAAGVDLILTAERLHRDLVVQSAPSAHRRTFALKEFARLVSRTGPGDPREIVRAAAQVRGELGAVPTEEDDIPDGYRLEVPAVRRIAREIAHAVKDVADVLAPPPPVRRPRPHGRPRPAPASRPRPGKSRV
jgi:protein-tyrosine phosphatase